MAVSLSNTAHDSASFTTASVTLANEPIGAAAADRLIFVCLGFLDFNSAILADPTSVTIGGVTATQAIVAGSGAAAFAEYIYWAPVPTGTTASVVVTFPSTTGSTAYVEISVYRVTGADTSTPVSATAITNTNSHTQAVSQSITVPTNGALIAGAGGVDTGNATGVSWTNATQDVAFDGALTSDLLTSASRTTAATNAITANNSSGSTINMQIAVVALQAAASATPPSLNGFFEQVKLKRPIIEAQPVSFQPQILSSFKTSPFLVDKTTLKQPKIDTPDTPGKSPAISSPYVTSNFFDVMRLLKVQERLQEAFGRPFPPGQSLSAWFDPTKLIKVQERLGDSFIGTVPGLSNAYVTAAFLETIKLKQPVIDKGDAFPPLIVPPNIVEQPFFDAIRLKPKLVETPIIIPGSSPPIAVAYLTREFFEPVRLKQPVIDKPSDMAPMPVRYLLPSLFDQVKPLKVQERFSELYPQQFWTPESYDPFFDKVKLLKVPERLQEAFGAPFPPPILETAAFFDTLRLKQPPAGLDFLQATAQSVTIQNALTDWFATVKPRQPVIDQPVVVYYPPFVAPTFIAEYEVLFLANVGRLMGHF